MSVDKHATQETLIIQKPKPRHLYILGIHLIQAKPIGPHTKLKAYIIKPK